jgi:hypothetical protein
MDECLIFQKITSQEQVIISALDHLEKNNKTTNKITNKKYEEDEDDEDDEDEY